MIDHKSGNSDWEGGGCNTTHLFRRISAFPLIRRQLRTLNSVEIVFFTSWPCRMALSVASFLISRMAESVQPPRFSTANGRNVIPAARTASPTWFSFLRWASLAAWPGSSAPRSMESLLRAAVTVTSKHRSCPFVPANGNIYVDIMQIFSKNQC